MKRSGVRQEKEEVARISDRNISVILSHHDLGQITEQIEVMGQIKKDKETTEVLVD